MAQYRGTTPTHTFTTDIDLTNTDTLYLSYAQGEGCKRKVIVEKTKIDLEIRKNAVDSFLTQEETLKFCPDDSVEMQFRATFITPEGKKRAVASNKMYCSFQDILKGGVI